MANVYYTPSGTPATGAQGSSSDIRSEFSLVETGLDKLPALTADYVIKVNAGGTALEPVQFLAVAQGGTGAVTLTDGGILLGSGTGAVTALAVLANGEMIVGDGTTDPAIESGATLRTSIGVGTGDNVTFTNVTGTGVGTFNSLVLTTDLIVAHGGTGVSTLTNGGILLGSGAGAITATAVLANGEMVVGDGTTDPVLESGATLRTSIGVGTGDNVTFTNVTGTGVGTFNSLTLTTDLTVANGGTGVSTLTDGGILLGSGTGAITATAVLANGEMVVGDGTTDPVLESGATLRTSIGVGTGDSVTFNALTLTTDLTVANGGTGASTFTNGGILLGSGSGAITAMAVLADGAIVIGDGTTDPVALSAFSSSTGTLKVANGGTGASTLTNGGILLGSGTSAVTATAVLANGEMVVGDGTTDPVLESGATLRTSIGVGTGDSVTFNALTLTTDLTVANGGTGASTLTDGGTLIGSGTGAITALGQGTNGQIVIGSTGVDPVLATITAGSGIEINNTAGGIEVVSTAGGGTVTSVATAGTENGLTLTGGPITTTGTITLGGTLSINNGDWSGTDLAVGNGGTGVSTLTNGGILLGSGTSAITALAVLANGEMIVGDGTTDPAIESGATLRTSIGLGTGDAASFSSLTLSTDLSVANGGTGASTFTNGGVLLGSGTGAITAMAVLANGAMIVGDGTTDPVAESGSTLRASIGVGVSDDVTFADITGDAGTFTSIALTTVLTVGDGGTGVGTLTNGGVLLGSGTGPITATGVLSNGQMIVGDGTTDPALESGATLRTSIGVGTGDSVTFAGLTLTADLTVANGGTGVSTFTDGGILLGSGTGPITATAVLTNGQMIVGDGTTDPALESGATLRTSIGVGSADNVTFNNVTGAVGAFSSLTLTTDLPVTHGGTGVSTLTNGGVLLGSGTGAITAMAVLANSAMIVGDGSGDPVAESGATLRTSIGVGTGDNVSFAGITGSGILSIDSTTDSTSTTTGSIHTDGGLGVVKNVHIKGNLVTTDAVSTTNTKLGVGAADVLASGSLRNTAFGNNALGAQVTGDDCTAVGHEALLVNTGIRNTAFGSNALSAHTTANSSTAVGHKALTLSTANDNTAVGAFAGDMLSSGSANTAIGAFSLGAMTTSHNNTSIGYNTLSNATGGDNTALGQSSGATITTGNSNTVLGSGANISTGAAVDQIALGAGALTDQNNQVAIGSGSARIKNEFDTDAVWSQSSDRRRKTNINDAVLGLDFINDLRVVTYNHKPANELPIEWGIDPETEINTTKTMHSLIAQEALAAIITAGVDPDTFAGWGADEQGQRISKEAYIMPLIKAIQQLTARLEALEGK